MRVQARWLFGGLAVLTLGFLAAGGLGRAADKGLAEKVDKLAALAAKDPAAARTEAAALAKSIDEDGFVKLKELMKKRTKDGKGGLGVGAAATGMPDDGMEARIQNLSRRAPTGPALEKDADALTQMAYRTAAVAEITALKGPETKDGEKDPKLWKQYSAEMLEGSYALAKAVQGKEPKPIKDAAVKLNASCTNCHGKFRD